jgi:hypothetical protein
MEKGHRSTNGASIFSIKKTISEIVNTKLKEARHKSMYTYTFKHEV